MKRTRAFAFLMFWGAPAWAQQLEPFGLEGMNVTSLAITPIEQGIPTGTFLYASTDGQGVFRRDLSSPDSNWIPIGLKGKKIRALYVYRWGVGPVDFNTPFAAVVPDWSSRDSTLVYRYTPEEKWVPSDSGMARITINGVVEIRGLFFSGHEPSRPLFAAGGYEMYHSFDTGRHWNKNSPGPGFTRALEAHQPSGLVWAGGSYGRDTQFPWIARSSDQGASWQASSLPFLENLLVRSLAFHPRDSSIGYAALDGHVIKSIDAGMTWSVTGLQDLHSRYFTLALDPDDASHLWAGGEEVDNDAWQMVESFDGGDTWASIPPPQCQPSCPGISSLVPRPGKGHAVYIATGGNGVWFYESRFSPPKAIRVPADFSTIQAAIDFAAAGDSVLVSPGIYVENIDFHGKNVAVRSIEGPEKTIIDGNQKGSVVTFASGEYSAARIEGFTLRKGSGTAGAGNKIYGGAIYCASSSPTIVRNVIRENVVIAGCGALGGGIAITGNSAPVIEGNHIYDNSVTSLCDALVNFGGGILISGTSAPRLLENTITRNGADFGGIAVMDTSRPTIQRNIIARNFRGGILVSQLAQPVIGGAPGGGNDIAENDGYELERRPQDSSPWQRINARYNYLGACPPTENEVFPLDQFDTSNCRRFAVRTYFPLEKGNQWTFGDAGALTETIIDTFTLGKRHLFYRFDQFRHVENMALRLTEENKLTYRLDPMSVIEHTWVDFGAEIGEQWKVGLPEATWTVELQSKTDTVTVPAGTFTECYRYYFRFSGSDNDWIEWYAPGVGPVKRVLLGFALIEYPLVSAVIHGVKVSVEEKPAGEGPAHFILHQNFPNPLRSDRPGFHMGTMIRYEIPQPSSVSLEVYNLLGQKVRTLFSGSRQTGTYHVRWDGKDDAGQAVAGGVYLCRLRAGDWVKMRKLVLMP